MNQRRDWNGKYGFIGAHDQNKGKLKRERQQSHHAASATVTQTAERAAQKHFENANAMARTAKLSDNEIAAAWDAARASRRAAARKRAEQKAEIEQDLLDRSIASQLPDE